MLRHMMPILGSCIANKEVVKYSNFGVLLGEHRVTILSDWE